MYAKKDDKRMDYFVDSQVKQSPGREKWKMEKM